MKLIVALLIISAASLWAQHRPPLPEDEEYTGGRSCACGWGLLAIIGISCAIGVAAGMQIERDKWKVPPWP